MLLVIIVARCVGKRDGSTFVMSHTGSSHSKKSPLVYFVFFFFCFTSWIAYRPQHELHPTSRTSKRIKKKREGTHKKQSKEKKENVEFSVKYYYKNSKPVTQQTSFLQQ
jgi:hypothetical protein